MAGRSQLPVQIMENQTGFDLNAAVESWRNELAAQPNLASDDRRELETHLRDAIAGFQQRGLNDEESFWLARRRVGRPQQIGEEFIKADPAKIWRERAFWATFAFLAIKLLLPSFTCAGQEIINYVNMNTDAGEFVMTLIALTLLAAPTFILVLVAILLSKGRLKRQTSMLAPLLKNRLHLAISAIALVIVFVLIPTALFQWHLAHSPRSTALMTSIGLSIEPLGLVALLVWLMPPQNQKTPKRA